MKNRRIAVLSMMVLTVGLGSAWAQIAVTDRLTTARNAVVATLKTQIVDVVRAQQGRLRDMARRLSREDLAQYAAPDAPPSAADAASALPYGESYRTALRYGDATGTAFERWARTRQPVGDLVAGLSPAAREAIERGLATLDATDSSLIVATHQVGALRALGGSAGCSEIPVLKTAVDTRLWGRRAVSLSCGCGAAIRIAGAGEYASKLRAVSAPVARSGEFEKAISLTAVNSGTARSTTRRQTGSAYLPDDIPCGRRRRASYVATSRHASRRPARHPRRRGHRQGRYASALRSR